MRTLLGYAVLGGLGISLAGVGCGGGDSSAPFGGDDSGSSGDTGTGDDGSIITGDGGIGHDGTTGNDATTGGDGGSNDATLDIAFPDGFTVPDTAAADSGGGEGSAEAGCAPNGVTCNGTTATTCTNGVTTVTQCTGGAPLCADGFGCIVCAPGSGSCNGSTGSVCKSDGSGYTTNNCDPLMGLSCSGGICQGDCAASNIGQSYIGCEYYAVTMLNHLLDQGTFFFSVSISNTSTTNTATATISGGGLGAPISRTIAPGALAEVTLPWVKPLSCGVGPCNAGQPPAPGTTLQANGAYRIRTTEPVTVYQFSPRDYQIGGAFSYTNDASLLLPVNAMTGNYRVSSWPVFNNWPGLIAIVATQDATSVTLAPTSAITAGGGMGTNGGTITMNRGDVLQVTNTGPVGQVYGTDMSGSLVTANAPVEVLGGHSCIYIPATSGYCDHMEEVSFPIETLRNDYLVTMPNNVNGAPKQYVKIIGTAANTALVFDPAVIANQTIGAGQVLTFEATQHFRVTSNAPILVAQYMEGESRFTSGSNTSGDPSESVAVATAQFRTSYQFVAPANYIQNWLNIIAPTGAVVSVDGTNYTASTVIGASGYAVTYVPLCANNAVGCTGVHKATSAVPFGIQVYGYGAYTSYMYPGGLDLKRQ